MASKRRSRPRLGTVQRTKASVLSVAMTTVIPRPRSAAMRRGISADTRAMRRQPTMNSRSAGAYATPPASARARTTASLASTPRSQGRSSAARSPVGAKSGAASDANAGWCPQRRSVESVPCQSMKTQR